MADQQKGRIFISYRRADSAGYAGRIYDRLTAHFGEDAVFMDVDTIEAGVDFVEVLQNAVQRCDVLVALIGRRWLDSKDANGKRRLDNPEDFVRIEVAAALDRDIRVIPVLVDGVIMPNSTELPGNLKPLARRNALQVDHQSFNLDVQRLISQLELALKAAERAKAEKLRIDQEALEKKAADEKRVREAATKAAREKEERERKEREERAQQEVESREKAEVEERVRKTALYKERQRENIETIKKLFTGTWKFPLFMVGGITLLFLFGYIISNLEFPVEPEPTKVSFFTAPVTSKATSLFSPTATPDIALTNTLAAAYTQIADFTPLTTQTASVLGVGSTMTSEKDGMVMVYVPAGEFQMGNEDGNEDEKRVHTVYLDAFWIDQTEVTNAMYFKCVDVGECRPPSSTNSNTRDNYYGNPEFDDYPVIYVVWDDAKAYCEWAGRHLPTETEWEKAAGWDEDAHAQRVYPWGDNYDENYVNIFKIIADTTAVGSYEKSESFYGVYDMGGNVWEWTADWYDAYPGWDGSASKYFGQTYRVLRGGTMSLGQSDGGTLIRVSYRYRSIPSNSFSYTGFRCARDAD